MGRKFRIDDVARASGVSRATVDRVLNDRPGVRAETVAKVKTAIRTLGYSPSALSMRRADGAGRVGVLLSAGTNPLFGELRRRFETATRDAAHLVDEFAFGDFDPYRPETVAAALRNVDRDVSSLITVGVDAPVVAAEIDAIVERGTRVVTVVSDAVGSNRHAYVGQDNFAAGRTAGRLMAGMTGTEPGAVAVLIGHLQFRHLLDRQSGFMQAMAEMRPDLVVRAARPYGGDAETAREVVADDLAKIPDLRGVYLAGGGQPQIIDAVRSARCDRLVAIGHEVTAVTRGALADGRLQAVVAHDLEEVARKALDAALFGGEGGDPVCRIDIHVYENLPKAPA